MTHRSRDFVNKLQTKRRNQQRRQPLLPRRSKPVVPAGGASCARPKAKKEDDDEDGRVLMMNNRLCQRSALSSLPLLPLPMTMPSFTPTHAADTIIMNI